jgi:hypothetical protein
MIDDMALLKRTMQQMDAEDPTVAQAAKDRAALILSEAKLNFAKMAELIEARRLLLRPSILARIKKMDQPGSLGDAAFQDTGSALRREGQSFLQIAEAIEASGRSAPSPAPAPAARHTTPILDSEPLYPMDDGLQAPAWLRALLFVGRILLFPVRHPLRSLAIGLFALVLLYSARGVIVLAERMTGYAHDVAAVHRVDTAIASISSFLNERVLRRTKGVDASPTPATPVPSPTVAATPSPTPQAAATAAPSPSATPSPAPTAASAPSPAPSPASAPPAPAPHESAALAPPAAVPPLPPAVPTSPPDAAPRRETRGAPPSRSAANRVRVFEEMTGFPRNSRIVGPCRGGVGGCYWGGARF